MEMETIRAKSSSAGLVKIELNEQGDYTVISMDDTSFFDKFVAGFQEIANEGDRVDKLAGEIEKKYEDNSDFDAIMEKARELAQLNVGFSQKATSIIDSIFGADTTKKYYREAFEAIPDFLPGVDSIIDFLDQLTPEVERLFKKRVEVRAEMRKKHMAKYQPQDHKKRTRKTI